MERIKNEMKVLLDPISCNEAVARSVVTAFLMQADPTAGELADVKTAVSEAVTNCIVHAYRGVHSSRDKIEILCRLGEGGDFYIRIKDKGCGIANVKQAMEPLFTTAPEEERAGLGFAVMESFMDSVAVRSALGKGTSVTMKKRIMSRELLKAGADNG
ncbi:MAG: anti-sigma F factor [Oscillospiraceae bacterium]|nr:anti-sigma F factor [Oscillospiraceae bacterium]